MQVSNAPAGAAAAETGRYSYDAAGRMLSARDDKRNEVVNSLSYDGFGNRLSETQAGTQTTYTYDASRTYAPLPQLQFAGAAQAQ